MAKINKFQSSFATGEISPLIGARIDVEKYAAACRTAINMVVLPFGPITRRPGFKYVAALEDQTKQGRLFPFEYSNVQSYILEFTNTKLRFYKDQGLILQGRTISNGTFTSGIAGWTNTSSGTGSISHDAINGRLTLTGVGGGNEARATSEQLSNYGVGIHNCSVDVYTSTVSYKVGTTSNTSDISSGTLTVGTGKTFSFTPTTNGNVYITFESAGTASIDNVVITPVAYEINTPYSDADIQSIQLTQSFDTVYITSAAYAPRKLVRNGHDNWTLSTVSFSEPAWLDENTTATTITPSGTTGSITITASSGVFATTDVGRAIRYKSGPDLSSRIQYTGTASQVKFDITFYPQGANDVEVNFVDPTGARTAKTYTAGVAGVGQFSIADGQITTGDTAAANYKVEIQPKYAGSGKWGWITITGYTSATQVTASVQRELAGTNASTYWRLGAWSETTGYPAYSTFHEQRLWFANTVTQPNTIWGSRSADFENFQYDSDLYKGIAEGSSSVTFSLETPSIQFISGLRSLLCGCSNGIIPITGTNGSISALDTPSAKLDGNYKCEAKSVVKTADEIIFIEQLKKRINSAAFSYEKDGFKVDELTLLADHISATTGFKQLAYAETPNRVLWALKDDGTLSSCTFKANQNLTGWARHSISGTNTEVESIAVIPGSSYSELWAIVKRTINGNTKRYVEVMQPYFYNMNKEDSFFVDSGLVYSGLPVTTISGLDHLEGETVTVLSDGRALPDEVVTGGSINLPDNGSVVVVGLGYNSDLEPVYQEGGSRLGATQMSNAKIVSIGLRLYETLNLQLGSDVNNLSTVSFRDGSDPMDESPPIYTGDKVYDFDDDWGLNYTTYIRQNKPYPMTVMAILFKAEVSDQ